MNKKFVMLMAFLFLLSGWHPADIFLNNSTEMKTLALINKERSAHNLPPLKKNWEVARVCREKSEEMARLHYFSQLSPAHGDPIAMLNRFAISYTLVGANIGRGQHTPEELMHDWMHSDKHRDNMLNPIFTQAGVGICRDGESMYWTVIFIS